MAGVAGALADGDVDGFAGRRHHQYPAPGAVRGGDQRAHGGGFAGPGRRGQRAHQLRRTRDGLDRPFLIRRQPRGVLAFDPQLGARVAGIDQVQQDGFFGQDAVQGEAFMALTLVRRPRDR